MSDLVRYEIRPPAAVITLARPEKRNALSRAMIAELDAAVRRAAVDSQARCVVLTGDGPAFCAGMDLDELRSTLTADDKVIWADAQRLAELFDRIYSLPKPTIAAVNGAAVAGGAGLVTVCDLALSVPTAKFGYSEVRRGLVAAMVLPHLLRHVGERCARYLLLTGELIDAEDAVDMGLINQVVGATSLLDTALAWAKACAEGGPHALATTKDLLKGFSSHALSVEEGAKASAAPRLGDECRAGLAAFFDKRPVPWAAGS
jgi:methylglutaconyl-CoA hydratase